MLNALSASRPSRRLATLLLAVFAAASVAGFAPVPVSAQSSSDNLVPSVITKEQAKEQADAADKAAAADSGGSIPLIGWFGIIGVVVIGAGLFYAFRDSSTAVAEDRRSAPVRPLAPSTTRGAPKGMFEGEGAPGGQTRRSKNRAKAKRQKHARRANRPK